MLRSKLVGAIVNAFVSLTFARVDRYGLQSFCYRPIAPTLINATIRTTPNLRRQAPSTTSSAIDDSCIHGSETRGCWGNGYSIATDFDKQWPDTGRTRSYDWTITHETCNPDGKAPRQCSLVNGIFPGPVLEADWGDTIAVTIHNQMPDNGTSIHWHGIRQLNTNAMDGTNGLTECPIAPGHFSTYKFQATQFGTSWYHSHHLSQYGDGLLGPIVINGPATANYDIDVGPIPVGDWYYTGSFAEDALQNAAIQALAAGAAPDTLLVNGTNGVNSGIYSTINFEPGKAHRLRFINTAVEDALRVSLDGHLMQVITADFVPIQPVWADSVVLAIGQRYDVIVLANQTLRNYWLRVTAELDCSDFGPDTPALAIVHYDGADDSNPTTNSSVISTGCTEPGILSPYVANDVGSVEDFKAQARDLDVDVYAPGTATNNQNLVFWGINMTAIQVQWDDPTLEYVRTGNASYPVAESIIELPDEGVWVYWVIQEVQGGIANVFHPMHLHGHDFYVLGSGTGQFDFTTDPDKLTYDNPVRRDTTQLPGNGWVALAFPTDNPGAWLFHCHIEWHVSEGLGVQFLESKNAISIPDSFTDQCNTWKAYYQDAPFKQQESGL